MIQPHSTARCFESAFEVRYDECNPYRHAHYASYFRYLQEAAFNAGSTVGYDLDHYARVGCMWLIREIGITFHHHPLRYRDQAFVTTWAMGFQRVRSRHGFLIQHGATGGLLAEAYIDWVFFDFARCRPITVQNGIVDAYCPEGFPPPETTMPREPFPPTPPAPSGTFTCTVRPAWRDIDEFRHVNNTMYITYLEEAALLALHACGWSLEQCVTLGSGPLPRSYRLDYKQSAVWGDELDITTWFSHLTATGGCLHQTITRRQDGTVLINAHAEWDWVDYQTRTIEPVPAEFVADCAPLITLEAVV